MSATIMSRDNLEIVRVIEEMTAAFQRADLPGVLAAYDEGAAVAFEPGKPASGGAALGAGVEMLFTLRPRFSYRFSTALTTSFIAQRNTSAGTPTSSAGP